MPRKRLSRIRKLRSAKLIESMNFWVGSWFFLVAHIIWFMIWLAQEWDINLLTMVVSLEAIILMIILLMAQNRQSIRDDLRDEADLQADLQSVKLAEDILKEIRSMKREIRDKR